MYPNPNLLESPFKIFISALISVISDVFHNTVNLIGPVIGVVVVVGVVGLVAIAIWYAIESIRGHQMEQPGPEIE